MKTKIFNQRGLGLVEVMVAASIMGGLSLVIMRMNEQGVQGVARTENRMEIVDFDREINSHLSEKVHCSFTLQKIGVGSGVPVASFTGATGTSFSNFWTSGPPTGVKYIASATTGTIRGKVKLISARINNYNATDKEATLEKTYQYKLSPTNITTRTTKKILSLTVIAGAAEECVLKAGEATGPWIIGDYGIYYPTGGGGDTVAIGKVPDDQGTLALDVEGQVNIGNFNKITGDVDNLNSIVGGSNSTIIGNSLAYHSMNIGHLEGINNGYASLLIGGYRNSVGGAGNYSMILGGWYNTAGAGIRNVIIGGESNTITNEYNSAIVGGQKNKYNGAYGFMGGGNKNVIFSTSSVALGGSTNSINSISHHSGAYTTVGSTILGYAGSIVGGLNNTIGVGPSYAAIIAGRTNYLDGSYSTILGGLGNSLSSTSQSGGILGGTLNDNSGPYSVIIGGTSNSISTLGSSALIAGGDSNKIITGTSSAIIGGSSNSIAALNGVIVGGAENMVAGAWGGIVAGFRNSVQSNLATIVGGIDNKIVGNFEGARSSIILGGEDNKIEITSATHYTKLSAIVGGSDNYIRTSGTSVSNNNNGNGIFTSNRSTITGFSTQSVILGGQDNSMTQSGLFYYQSAILGGGSNWLKSASTSAVISGNQNTIEAASDSVIIGGEESGIYGGQHNIIMGNRLVTISTVSGAIVLGDNSATYLNALASNRMYGRFENGYQFCTNEDCSTGVRAFNGATSWGVMSSRKLKEDFQKVDFEDILDRIFELDITSWKYKKQKKVMRHIGPMAEDFHRLFVKPFKMESPEGLISQGDLLGVSLAGVKGLDVRTRKIEQENEKLRNEVQVLRDELMLLKKDLVDFKNVKKP